jgi:hypothetical protein
LFLMYGIREQGTTLAPTFGELTSIVVTLASHNNQAVAPSAMSWCSQLQAAQVLN